LLSEVKVGVIDRSGWATQTLKQAVTNRSPNVQGEWQNLKGLRKMNIKNQATPDCIPGWKGVEWEKSI
jgi:hypothetical protein